MAAWGCSSNAKSILGVKRRRAWLVLGWVTTWGVARSRLTSGPEPVRLITVGPPAGVGVRARAQSFICDRSSVASLHHSTNTNSFSESIDLERKIVLGWMTILGVEVSVKLHTLEPRSAQSRAFLSGVKGKVSPSTSVKRSIFCEESKAVTRP